MVYRCGLGGFCASALAGVIVWCGCLVCGCRFCGFVTDLVFRCGVGCLVWVWCLVTGGWLLVIGYLVCGCFNGLSGELRVLVCCEVGII